ncbi:hypothetical protein F5051DRAFT_163199 [Lentinula edodes]|nr:hypothetical protein F5051DRAFT_163199 [Lentinula edodes]
MFHYLFVLWRNNPQHILPLLPDNPFALDTVAGYRYNRILTSEYCCLWYLMQHIAVAFTLYLLQVQNLQHNPSCAMICDFDVDFVEPILESGYTGRALLGFLSENLAIIPISHQHPWISLISLDSIRGFLPPTLLQEDAEQTLDPMRTFHYQLVADNDGSATTRFLVYPNSNPSFLVSSFFEPPHSQAFFRGRLLAPTCIIVEV